jgi:drug/metabolite transporter (DMT)-like permease
MKTKYYSYLLLLLAGFFFSFLAVFSEFATRLGIDGLNQIIWRQLFALIVSGIAAFFIFKQKPSISFKEYKYVFINGLLFAGATATFTLGIYLGSPIAKAVALNYAYPLVVIIASFIFFKEKPSFRAWIATVISFISVAFILEIWTIQNFFSLNTGDLLELLNSLFYGLIIVWGKKMTNDTKLHPLKSIFYSNTIAVPLVFFLGMFISTGLNISSIGTSIKILTIPQFLTVLALSLFMILPIALIYKASIKAKAHVVSIFLLTELIWVYILGLLLFSQSLSIFGVLGMIGIIVSILLL